MRTLIYRLLLISSLLLMTPLMANAATPDPVENAYSVRSHWRELGYSVGDTAEQTIIVETPAGYALDSSSLPDRGASSAAVELVQTVIKTEQRNNKTHHDIRLLWQNFQVMQEIRPYSLPALDLSFRRNDESILVHVNAASIMVASVLPSAMNAARAQPLADVKPAAADTLSLLRQFGAAVLLLLLCLGYFAWRYDWLQLRTARQLPFRLAWRQINKAQTSAHLPPAIAMQALCQAFDASAGISISREQLPQLFAKQPNLLALKTEIVDFYAASEQLFFAGPGHANDSHTNDSQMNYSQISQLAKRLMRLETP